MLENILIACLLVVVTVTIRPRKQSTRIRQEIHLTQPRILADAYV